MSKVLYVATEPVSGMLPFASAIINNSVQEGNDVYVLSVSRDEIDYKKNISPRVKKHIALKYPLNKLIRAIHKFFPLGMLLKIIEICRLNKIRDIFFLTGEYGLTFSFGQFLANQYNVNYVVHDLEPHPTIKETFWDVYFKKMVRKAIKVYPTLITCSKSQYKSLLEMFPKKVINYMPFPSLVTEEMKKAVEICPELIGIKNYILFFGSVGYYKGVDILYNAFLESKICKNTTLVIAGGGEQGYEARDDERNVVRINRYIRDAEVAGLYSNAKLVVYPYRQATMSGVLTIAHYFKRKVVASNVPFFEENHNEQDIIFDRENPKSLISILNDCCEGNE